MAIRYYGHLASVGFIRAHNRTDYVGAASGGTLAGSQDVQIVFDDAVFGSGQEAKQRLLAAIESIENGIECAKTWPIDITS